MKKEEQLLRNKREEVLLDALAYYTEDTNRRCYKDSTCRYNPNKVGKTKKESQGCAVGRLISDYYKDKFDNATQTSIYSIFRDSVNMGNGTNGINIPKNLIYLERDFLQGLQNLHDQDDNWEEKSLSTLGMKNLNSIIMKSKLRKTKFKKYLNEVR